MSNWPFRNKRLHIHHFDGAAGETKGHGPHGPLATPVDNLVERRKDILGSVSRCLETQLVALLLGDGGVWQSGGGRVVVRVDGGGGCVGPGGDGGA